MEDVRDHLERRSRLDQEGTDGLSFSDVSAMQAKLSRGTVSLHTVDPNDARKAANTIAACVIEGIPFVVGDASSFPPLIELAGDWLGTDTLYLARSSGTLADTRLSAIRRSDFLKFVPFGVEHLGLARDHVFCETTSLLSDMAVTNLLLCLLAGARWCAPTGSPIEVPALLRRQHVTSLRMTPSVLALVERVARRGAPASFPGVRNIGLGGEVATWQTVATASRLFPEATITNTYGTSETGGFITAGHPLRAPQLPGTIGPSVVGAIRPGVVLDFAPTGNGVSEVVLSSTGFPEGVINPSTESRDPWPQGAHGVKEVRTGDLGVLHRGQVFIEGRLGRRLKVRGSFVDLDSLESVLRNRLGIRTVAVARGDQIAILVHGSDRDLLMNAKSEAITPEPLGFARIVEVQSLPLSHGGKADYTRANLIVWGLSKDG